MERTIQVPLDGSPSAEHALPWGAELARRTGAELQLVRVHLPPVTVATEGFVALYPVVEDDTLRKAEADYFAGVLARMKPANPDLKVTATLLEIDPDRDVADTLARHAGVAEFVVMTTHGRGAFARFWLGSVADEFVRHASVPTVLIRPEEGRTVDPNLRPKVRNIIVPLDGSELAERIVGPVGRIARAFGGEVTLLMVFEPTARGEALPGLEPYRLPEGWNPNPAMEKARGYLDRVARDLRDHASSVHTKLETKGPAVSAIMQYAETHPDSVVALATHGRGGLTRMLLGSVADKVIRGSRGPVLVYRPATGG
jgi:nucleotide-binding universal stress UspA family protein